MMHVKCFLNVICDLFLYMLFVYNTEFIYKNECVKRLYVVNEPTI